MAVLNPEPSPEPYRCTQDTARFCTETLCEPELVAVLNAQFVCWGGDVRSSDAFRVRWLRAWLLPMVFPNMQTRVLE